MVNSGGKQPDGSAAWRAQQLWRTRRSCRSPRPPWASIPCRAEIGLTAMQHPLLLRPPSPQVPGNLRARRDQPPVILGRRRTRKPGRVDPHASKSQDSLVFRPTEVVVLNVCLSSAMHDLATLPDWISSMSATFNNLLLERGIAPEEVALLRHHTPKRGASAASIFGATTRRVSSSTKTPKRRTALSCASEGYGPRSSHRIRAIHSSSGYSMRSI